MSPHTHLGTFPFQPPLGSAVHPPSLFLERSGSLRHDIQRGNLKNGRFWSLQLGSGRGSRCSESSIFIFFNDLTLEAIFDYRYFGTPKWVSALDDAHPGAPKAQFRPLLGKTERQIQRVLRRIWTQLAPDLPKVVRKSDFCSIWCSDMGIFYLTSLKRNLS